MKKETLEEAAESRFGTDMDSIRGSSVYDLNTDLKRGFIEGAKWQAERMYSEDEVGDIIEQTIEKFYKHFYYLTKAEMKDIWFEQFKKK